MELTLLSQRGTNANNKRGWLKRKDFPQKKEDGNEEAKWCQQLHPLAKQQQDTTFIITSFLIFEVFRKVSQ